MKQRLWKLAAAVSLVLAVATAALWPLSHFRAIFWGGYAQDDDTGAVTREWQIGSLRGQIIWQVTSYGSADGAGWAGHWSGIAPADRIVVTPRPFEPPRRGVGAFGFYWERRTVARGAADDRLLQVPHWFVVLAFCALPARRWLTRRPSSPNACPACGYDCRATPARCPECGVTVVARKMGALGFEPRTKGL